MKSSAKIERADTVEVTITFTATIFQWKAIKNQLSDNNLSAMEFSGIVRNAIEKVEDRIEIELKE